VADVTVRYFASARAAAGSAEETISAATVGDALASIRDRHSQRFGEILDACSLLLDGRRVHDDATPLAAAVTLDVLPPFAGG
jgi:molybdopterin converting factor small subunit